MGLIHIIDRAITAIKQCEGCAMRRANMKLSIERTLAHIKPPKQDTAEITRLQHERTEAWNARMAIIKAGGDPDAIKPQAVQAIDASGTEARTTAGRQAGNSITAHGDESVAEDTGAGPSKGRVRVPGVRKVGGRKG